MIPEWAHANRRRIALLLLALACLAPTPGDVGGCGEAIADLDADAFFEAKRTVDCEACADCSLVTKRCISACSAQTPPAEAFPEGCFPLVHDGKVCLRALRSSSCDAYEQYVSDTAPVVPSECDFCPEGTQ